MPAPFHAIPDAQYHVPCPHHVRHPTLRVYGRYQVTDWSEELTSLRRPHSSLGHSSLARTSLGRTSQVGRQGYGIGNGNWSWWWPLPGLELQVGLTLRLT